MDVPKSEAWCNGYTEACRQFETTEGETEFVNPFTEGTPEWEGFEEGVYDFTQK